MTANHSDPTGQKPTMDDHAIPSVIFAIPFPKPSNSHSTTENSPKLLLYTFPRSVYERPPIDPQTGKRGKEKLIKKVERKWQEEVREGEEIKRGELADASAWQKVKGTAARGASGVIKAMANSHIEVLGRLPPKKKLGKVTIFHPNPADIPPWLNIPRLSAEEMRTGVIEMLTRTAKQARNRIIVSGILLPVTLAIDILVIVPLFLFEINMAYFALQANGAKKAGTLTGAEKKKRSTEPPPSMTQDEAEKVANSVFNFETAQPRALGRAIEHLYSICCSLDAGKFPSIENVAAHNYKPGKEIAIGLIEQFKASVPEEVASRHLLNEERVAEDLDRSLKKAAKEYIKTIK